MSGAKILSSVPAAGPIGDNDVFYVLQGGNSRKTTGAAIKELTKNATTVGGFQPSQTPVSNQIPVVKADSSVALPGGLFVSGDIGTQANLYINQYERKLAISDFTNIKPGHQNYIAIGSSSWGDNAYMRFVLQNVERARFNEAGDLLLGVSTGGNHTFSKSVAADAGIAQVSISASAEFYRCSNFSYNTANTAMILCRDTNTGRSLNAAGTLNASGADYAEYEIKSDTCGDVTKGQIIGIDINGHVTDRWAEAVSFGVKSTNPNLVGGDTWGTEDVVGKRPEEPQFTPPPYTGKPKPEDETDTLAIAEYNADQQLYQLELTAARQAFDSACALYQIEFAAFEARLEAARQKVDRVAYSGKVPCNVTGAAVGDYIIAAQDGEGIKGVAVADPDFSQYKKAVGRVRRILDDGRPEIAVIVH